MTTLLRAAPVPRTAGDLPAALLALADSDADALADCLHDGALQALVVARYATDAVVRGADPALARDAVQEALVALRRAVWQLRPRAARGLGAALHELAASRVSAGCAPLHLDLDEDVAALVAPAAAAVAYRLVQRACDDQPLHVRVRRTADGAALELDAPVADPAGEALRARAAGARFCVERGATRLSLPVHDPLTEDPS